MCGVERIHRGLSRSDPRSTLSPKPKAQEDQYLDVQLPDLREERSNAVVAFGIVQQNELHIYITPDGFTKRLLQETSQPLLLPGVTNAETVHSLNLSIALKYLNEGSQRKSSMRSDKITVHRRIQFDRLIDHVQTGVGDHLDHMPILTCPHGCRSSFSGASGSC